MILAKKVRLKPTKEQEKQLWKSAGTARWTYNWTVAKQEENYRNGGKFLSNEQLRKELTQLKQGEEYAWLYDVSNNITKQAVKDACDAYQKFFTKLKKEGKRYKKSSLKKAKQNLSYQLSTKDLEGHPRFKSRKHSKPSFYHDTEKLKVKDHMVRIEKVGWVKTAELIPMDVPYTNPRISFDGKYWYISVGLEQATETFETTHEVLGIDVGIKELAVCSNGEKIKNINKTKPVKKAEKRFRRLQRKASRKYEMNEEGNRFAKTCNIIKIEKQIRREHRRLNGIRNNHIHQATNAIVKTKPCKVVMETLNVKGMMKNKHLSKAIQQQKLYDFKRILQYKCEKYGIAFVEADPWYPSSKMCSSCGTFKKDLKLSDRVYRCDCGLVIDRDLNAAINLSRYEEKVVG